MSGRSRVIVWDPPIRLFHWALVATIAGSFLTQWLGRMEWHMYCGYAAATLVTFRLFWGLVGSETALFARFVRGPGAIMRYLRTGATDRVGHSPLGAVSVVALLTVVVLQVGTGLFSNDDILFDGPWSGIVSKELSDRITGYHVLNKTILLVLLVLHVGAIAVYRWKGEDLIGPMITGRMAAPAGTKEPRRRPLWLAAAGLIAAAALIGVAFRFWGPWG